MPSRKTGSADSNADGFVVTASENFSKRRLTTIHGLNIKQYRALGRGEKVKISVEAYNAEKTLYIKCKEAQNGDNVL